CCAKPSQNNKRDGSTLRKNRFRSTEPGTAPRQDCSPARRLLDFSFRERDRRHRNENLARDPWRRSSLEHAETHRAVSRARGHATELRAHSAHPESRRVEDEKTRRRRGNRDFHRPGLATRNGRTLSLPER